MSDLPPGWEWATLDEIGDYLNGRAFKRSEWSPTGRPIVRIQNLTGTSSNFHHFDGALAPQHTAHRGDLLVSWAATLGAYLWQGPEAAINQHIFKVESWIDVKFHYYLINHLIEALYNQSHGSGIVHVTRSKFGELRFGLPPASEQRRIVTELDSHLSHIEAGESSISASLDRLSDIVSATRARVIDAASTTCGELADVVDKIEAGRSFGAASRPANSDEWGIVKVSAMTWGDFRPGENKAVADTSRVEPRFEIKAGDILVSRANTIDYVGAPVLVGETRPRLLLSDKSLRITPKSSINPQWLVDVLAAPSTRRQIAQKSTGNQESMRNISQASLLSIEIPLHDTRQQREILEVIDLARAATVHLDADLQKTKMACGILRKSVLTEAFAGRLVPQDSTDEPASALLDRIRAKRAAQPKPRRTGRRTP